MIDVVMEQNAAQGQDQENYIDGLDPSNEWQIWRDNLAMERFENWRAHRGIH